MTKLDKLIELINLAKQNRRNRLEDKLRQQEYYGDTEVLFDPLTKTLNTNDEAWRAHGEALLANSEAMQTLQNKILVELDINTRLLKALDSQQKKQLS